MFFRQLLNDETACASYLLGCKTHGTFAVVDPHIDEERFLVVAETFDNGLELVETVSGWQGTTISRRLACAVAGGAPPH